jgi:hypothetical protein
MFKRMEASEETMKKNNINIVSSYSNSSSHGRAIFPYVFSFNAMSTSSYNEWLIDSGASYHMAKDKSIFSTLTDSNTKQIFVGDDRCLKVEGFGIIQLDDGHFNDTLCVPSLSYKFY